MGFDNKAPGRIAVFIPQADIIRSVTDEEDCPKQEISWNVKIILSSSPFVISKSSSGIFSVDKRDFFAS